MNNTYKLALGLFLLLIISLVWLESNEPDPVNWAPSYTNFDKIPLGTFVFYESWKDRKMDQIEEIRIPPYEYLNSSPKSGTYFFLNNYVNFDDNELDQILNWVSEGNNLFVSAYDFGNNLADTLGIELASYIEGEDFKSRPRLNLVNSEIKLEEELEFDHDLPAVFFKKIDTTENIVLGTASFGETKRDEKINFLKTAFGEGQIFLHSTPQAFSNYFLLKNENHRYNEALLAYLDEGPVLWDSYYKSGKSFFSSPLYILLNNRPLKWAYYFVLISGILFILFEGKRRQRTIPVVEPTENKSYEFTRTISQLYVEKGKFYELGIKKISIFMEQIRSKYRLDTSQINDQFYKDLSEKSENNIDETKKLFERIFNFQERPYSDKKSFFELAKHINTFKRKHG
ncbi:DUF4350 domain-containing protein [Gramella lutea]|uniref:DUF4350 domain-containing protein n=1 Tax=Christiangramia lutea TaxID=1607951 RepID=A0A9X1V2G1_9FLAO|nr:DUF4350 domain-containing protein [Christiangramia lutea]MCH4822826.1 DUF4350 domain-containing protein [Christiangramia lutea]